MNADSAHWTLLRHGEFGNQNLCKGGNTKKMKKKTLTIAIALVLVVALAVGATWAYLTAQTGPVVNTFTVGKILDNAANFTLNEHPLKNADTTDGVYQLDTNATPVQAVTYSAVMPGVDLPKDPTVTIKAGALKADAYLFVVVENKLADGLSYTLDGAWKTIGSTEDGKTLLTLDAGKLTAGNTDALTWKVLGGDKITVANAELADDLGTLTFNAYLVQAGGFETAAAAWNTANLVSGLAAA